MKERADERNIKNEMKDLVEKGADKDEDTLKKGDGNGYQKVQGKIFPEQDQQNQLQDPD